WLRQIQDPIGAAVGHAANREVVGLHAITNPVQKRTAVGQLVIEINRATVGFQSKSGVVARSRIVGVTEEDKVAAQHEGGAVGENIFARLGRVVGQAEVGQIDCVGRVVEFQPGRAAAIKV